MRVGFIGFWIALGISAACHALVLGVIWMDQTPDRGSWAADNAIYIPTPQMGQTDQAGVAVNASAGDRPAELPRASQAQAALGRLPTGAQSKSSPALAAPQNSPRPIPSMTAASPVASPPDGRIPASSPQFTWPTPAVASPPSRGPSNLEASAGQPYQQSDSESDPFSNAVHVEMRNGRVDARFGRKVKTTRPRFGFDAEQALMDHIRLSVVLKVNTDPTGKVTSVDVLRSSGNSGVDLATQLAIYNWWIEPPKGKDGHSLADVMVWKITYQ